MITIYPVGNNKSGARSTFDNRKLYKENIYPVYVPEPIDHWYEQLQYGRVDEHGDTVMIKSPKFSLKLIKKIEEPLFVMNFVNDAFEDFVAHIEKAVIKTLIDRAASIANLKPIRGWENPRILYADYLLPIKDSFLAFLNNNALENKIGNLNDFAFYFFKFVEIVADKFPVTLTAFLKSKYSTPHVSGLSIEFFLEDHGNDRVKFDSFISEGCYEFYVGAAKKHGFYVDKNAPWRITADLASPIMQQYMNSHGVSINPGTASDLFDLYYEKTFLTDIELLTIMLQREYN